MRLGLCCLFQAEPVSFRSTTAAALSRQPRSVQLQRLSEIGRHNVASLLLALAAARRLGIGAFRVMSPLFPRMTHPEVGYRLADLPEGEAIGAALAEVRGYARRHDVRLSLHPDQFVVLSSPRAEVLRNSVTELAYHGWLAESLGAEVINLHLGGVYGDKPAALARFASVFRDLPAEAASRLSLENDDRSYTVTDLLPLCGRLSLPLVYDVHHHRCNPDRLTVEKATDLAAETWRARGQEPYCHVSSPRNGWQGADRRSHADYLDPADFPDCWLGRDVTVDVEAKAKELAVLRLKEQLAALRLAV